MLYPSLQQLLFAALCLVIPAAIVLGHRRPNGPIVACGGAALGAFAVFWLLLGGTRSLITPMSETYLVSTLTLFGGIFLLLAAWALAISATAQARQWEWVVLLAAAGYVSVVAIIYSISQPYAYSCLFGPTSDNGPFTSSCTSYPLVYWLVIAGYLVGPAATLAYGLRPGRLLRRTSRVLPDGLIVSSLRTTNTSTQKTID